MKHYSVKINKNEALRFLGYHGNKADALVARQLNDAAALLEKIALPAYTYKVFKLNRVPPDPSSKFSIDSSVPAPQDFRVLPGRNETKKSKCTSSSTTVSSAENPTFSKAAETLPSDSELYLKGTSIRLPGIDALSFLEGCHSCILMAVTIGRRVDEELRRRQITDMSGAVILDSCASSAVESICNQLEADLEVEFEGRGLFLTDRFSPGYGDLPLDLQPAICRTLSTEKNIGLSITGGMLMMPTKSVTAFIGIADRPQPKKLTGCAHCRMNKTCNYRKAGVTCAG